MKDTVIKETGNSRFLRSNVAEDITFAEFIALLRAGQLPIDLAGINEEGIDTLGMPLGKSTLLDDETEAAIWGSPGDRKPTEALKTIFETLSAGVSEKAKVVTGTYTGNGSASRTISLGFRPKAVIINTNSTNELNDYLYNSGGNYKRFIYGASVIDNNPFDLGGDTTVLTIVDDGFTVYYNASSTTGGWVVGSNKKNTVFSYIAIA